MSCHPVLRAIPLALLLTLFAAPAFAQPTVAHATDAQKEAARMAYREGKQAFEAGEFQAALVRFRASDTAVASPNTRLMIGRCLARLGERAEAYMILARVAGEARAWGNERYEDAARAAEQELDRLRSALVMVQVEIDAPEGPLALEVGGRLIPRDAWLEPIPADPGVIEVRLRSDDGRMQHKTLELEAGVAATLTLDLPAPAAAVSAQPPPRRPATPARLPAPRPVEAGAPTFAYVLGGVGVAGLAAFGVLGALSADRFDELEAACPDRRDCAPALRDTADEGATLQTLANVSLVAGAVSLGAGAVLFVLELDSESADVAFTPDGVRLRGRF